MAAEGGRKGIRTPDTLAGIRAFQARALDHYAIPPYVIDL
jgi:hypothetical protein